MILIISLITFVISIVTASAVFIRRHKHLSDISFSIGLISTAAVVLGDTITVLKPESMVLWQRFVFISEVLMASSWLVFAVSYARSNNWNSVNRISKLLIYISPFLIVFSLLVPINDFFYSPEFESEYMLFLGNAGFAFNLLILLYSIIAMINFEVTLKSSSGIMRWKIKYTLIGIGGILAINIFYYSQALLYRSLNMNLLPVRQGVVLISILIIGYSILRHKAMDVKVVVSRMVVYRSITLFIIGFYLLGLGLIGEGMRYFGPNVGKNITTFLGFLGAIAILTIVLSEQMRRKVMVLINKNFYSQKYDYREQWLKFTQLISLKYSFEELLDAVAEGFQDAIGSTGAAVWLKGKDGNGYICVKTTGTINVDNNPNENLINFLMKKKWILNVKDHSCKKIVDDNADFFKTTGTVLVVPLLNVNDLLGFILLGEGLTDEEYNFEDYDLLKTLARQTTSAILNVRLLEELTESKEMEAVGRVSSFIIHDLKNAASKLSLITENAKEHLDNPEFQRDTIKAIVHTSEKIKNIIEKLSDLPKKMQLHFKDNNLGYCVRSAINELNLNGKSNVSFQELNTVKTKFDNEEIRKVIVNLLMNALDATDYKGDIKVTVGSEGGMGYVKVADSGCGISHEFMEKSLFRPFETTKKKGLGIGLYQCKVIVEAHSGRIKAVSEEGKGSEFIIYLPLKK